MKSLLSILSVALSCMFFAACSSSENEQAAMDPQPSPAVTRSMSQSEFVKAGNEFSLNLLRNVADASQGKSFVLSPLSVTYAFGMLNDGATGQTRQQIMKVLGFEGVSADSINALCHAIMQQAPQLDQSVDMTLANGVFVNQPHRLQQLYQQRIRQFYDAEAYSLDFYDPASPDFINDWCSQKTKGMIPSVLDELQGICYLINAIYFKADWTYAFDPDSTETDWFFDVAGEGIATPFMNALMPVDYVQTADFQAVRMPFGNEAYGMYVLLPAMGKTTADILSSLSTATLSELNNSMRATDVAVSMPRFGTKTHTELIDLLKAMGMTLPFSPMAELGGIIENVGNGDMAVTRAFQDAVVEVQEKGAKAAAVTVIGIETTAIPVEDSKTYFNANRPFIYLITEKSTGAIYFAGVFAGDSNTLKPTE